MTDKKGRETIPPYQENDYIKKIAIRMTREKP